MSSESQMTMKMRVARCAFQLRPGPESAPLEAGSRLPAVDSVSPVSTVFIADRVPMASVLRHSRGVHRRGPSLPTNLRARRAEGSDEHERNRARETPAAESRRGVQVRAKGRATLRRAAPSGHERNEMADTHGGHGMHA